MQAHLNWVPFDSPITITGFPISGVHILNRHSADPSPAFALPTSPDFSNGAGEWTSHRYCAFLLWCSAGRKTRPGPDGPQTEFLVRTAFANWELRLLAQDRDDRLLHAMAELHQRHRSIFSQNDLATRFNLLAQISSYSQGPDLHLGRIKWLQGLRGFSWGKAEINLKLTGFFEAEANLDDVSALHAVWANLNSEERTRAHALWPDSEAEFLSEFKRLYPSGFKLRRPAERTLFTYQPSHPDVGHSLHPSINLSLQVYDFYADGQLEPLMQILLSILEAMPMSLEKMVKRLGQLVDVMQTS